MSYRLCLVAALVIALCGTVGASAAPLPPGPSAWEVASHLMGSFFSPNVGSLAAKKGCGIDPWGKPVCSNSSTTRHRAPLLPKPPKRGCSIDPWGVTVCTP
jgi:hypothetical protein